MKNEFFSSDWHMYHKKIKEYCPHTRRGDTLEQMVDMILTNISEQTRPGDVLYNVGDVSFGTADQTWHAMKKIQDMGIEHHLIMGNHDKTIRSDQSLQTLFDSVQDKKIIVVGRTQIVLSHIPFACGMWDSAHYGSWHFYGHAHGSYSMEGKCMDVGIDTRPTGDMKMWSYEELKVIMDRQPVIKIHHR